MLIYVSDSVQKGRGTEAEAEFERLLGGLHVKSAIAELSKSDRGDELDTVKFSELLYGRHFKGINSLLINYLAMTSVFSLYMITLSSPYFAVVFMGSTIFALQQLSGINAVFYFSSTVFKSFGVPSDLANTCIGIANFWGIALHLLLCVLLDI